MKQKLLDIRRKTNVTTRDIAEQARLSVGDVVTVEAGGYTSVEKARRVIMAFNQLSGMQVRLDDIKISHSAASASSDISPLQTRA